jgi:hypothetical protein
MRWPAICHTISQEYGNPSDRYVSGYHTGIDIACAAGSPIYAAHDGTVSVAGWKGAYGNTVEVQANSSLYTSYHHMSSISVRVGQVVSAGKILGHIGSTGQSTGPHLHFEVRVNGEPVDPNPYLDGSEDVSQAGYNPAGFGDVFAFPSAVIDAFGWLANTKNWYRVGMVFLGVLLVGRALMSMAASTATGSAAVSKVTKAVKSGVKSKGGKSRTR